jgi:hypothetical protein
MDGKRGDGQGRESLEEILLRRHDAQENDILHNDTQHVGSQRNKTQHENTRSLS